MLWNKTARALETDNLPKWWLFTLLLLYVSARDCNLTALQFTRNHLLNKLSMLKQVQCANCLQDVCDFTPAQSQKSILFGDILVGFFESIGPCQFDTITGILLLAHVQQPIHRMKYSDTAKVLNKSIMLTAKYKGFV